MGEILSQSEIDELLNALNSGSGQELMINKEAAKEAKNYNFRRPSKFNKDHLRTLEIIFDNYSRLVSSFLSGYLRTAVSITVITAEQLTYSEFNNSLVNPIVLSIIDFEPMKGSVILELSANMGFAIIDRVLGGPGFGMKKLREFSEIEIVLLERILNQMVNFLVEPWENVVALTPRMEKIETNSQFAQIISPNEMIALVTLGIKIGSVEGMINFCIPHIVIEPVMERLNTKYWFIKNQEEEEKESYRDKLEIQLEKATVPVVVVIGKTMVTVSDLVHLQVGDIIPLDSYIRSDLNIMVGNLLKFKGKPGVNRGKNAIQITSLIDKEE